MTAAPKLQDLAGYLYRFLQAEISARWWDQSAQSEEIFNTAMTVSRRLPEITIKISWKLTRWSRRTTLGMCAGTITMGISFERPGHPAGYKKQCIRRYIWWSPWKPPKKLVQVGEELEMEFQQSLINVFLYLFRWLAGKLRQQWLCSATSAWWGRQSSGVGILWSRRFSSLVEGHIIPKVKIEIHLVLSRSWQ